MTVTKRTRFEVLRRDDHTCQYCGAKAPDVTLQIDHVIPVALGGDDKPGNLVTACRDCNSGKASIPPDSPLVQALSAEAAAYALGMTDKMTRFRADLESLDDYAAEFHERWDCWRINDEPLPLPAEYKMTLFRWKQMGIPVSVFDLAVPTANGKFNRERTMRPDAVFAYMAGVVWNMVNEREIDYSVPDASAAVYTANEAEVYAQDSWRTGRRSGETVGRENAQDEAAVRDLLQQHIDQMEPAFEENPFTGEPMFVGMVKRGA